MNVLNLKARYLFGVFFDSDDKDEIDFFEQSIDEIFDLIGNKSKLKNKLFILKKILENFNSENTLKILLKKLEEIDGGDNITWYEWKTALQVLLKFEISNDITIGEFLEYEKIVKKITDGNKSNV